MDDSVDGDPKYTYFCDVRGSVDRLIQSDGSTTQVQYSYDPFGSMNVENGSSNNPYGYTGREYNSDTGLNFYRARFYDSSLGRFMSNDSYPPDYNTPHTMNRYAYVLNNPVNFTDPFGLWYQNDEKPPKMEGKRKTYEYNIINVEISLKNLCIVGEKEYDYPFRRFRFRDLEYKISREATKGPPLARFRGIWYQIGLYVRTLQHPMAPITISIFHRTGHYDARWRKYEDFVTWNADVGLADRKGEEYSYDELIYYWRQDSSFVVKPVSYPDQSFIDLVEWGFAHDPPYSRTFHSGDDGHEGEYMIEQSDIPWGLWGPCKKIKPDAWHDKKPHDDSGESGKDWWREHFWKPWL